MCLNVNGVIIKWFGFVNKFVEWKIKKKIESPRVVCLTEMEFRIKNCLSARLCIYNWKRLIKISWKNEND